MENKPRQFRDLKILVVEDNETNLKILRIILDKNGCVYEIATDGHVAVEKYQGGLFNLVLMDCQMPNLDGLQATRLIRLFEEKNSKSRCPIVAMTANTMSGDQKKCFDAGMDDFLAKPFKSQDLIEKIKNWNRGDIHEET